MAAPLAPARLDEVKNIRIARPAGAINVRLSYPISVRPLPLTVFMHGGGWVLCDLDSHDHLCRSLALASNSVVASVDSTLRELVARCAAVQEAGDVVEIDAAMIVAEAHTEEAEYAGVRATLPSQLRTARVVLQAAQAPHSA